MRKRFRNRFPTEHRGCVIATMRDVAEYAGVSVTTVSHVINNTRNVSEELQDRVLRAMQELGYRPNVLARSLRKGQTRTISLIIPDSANIYFAEVARGLEDKSYTKGYSVILCNTDSDPQRELEYIETLSNKQVDGMILVSAGDNTESIEALVERQIPFVVVDRHLPAMDVDEVLTDNLQGSRQATQYLLELGHRRIGCITGPSMLTPSADRIEGYLQSLREADLEIDQSLIIDSNFQFDGGFSAMEQLLALPEPPTAVFACNDLMAIGATGAVTAAGLSIPDDLSIIGFDNVSLTSFTNPPLTTISQPKYQMGVLAAGLLLSRIEHPGGPVNRLVLPTELVVRGSCRAINR